MTRTILILTLALASLTAHATDTTQVENGNAVNTCKAPFQIYEAGMRQRPLAIVNEGTGTNFINCAFRATTNSYGQNEFAVKLRNYNAGPVAVRCTGVFGVEDGTDNQYSVKLTAIPGNGSALVIWTKADYRGARWQTNSSLQCLLPPGVGMTELPQSFQAK